MENVSYDAGANKTTFDLVIGSLGPDHGLVIMLFENTRRTQAAPLHSGITDLSIIRPGYDDASSGPFTDYFLSTLTDAGFSVIRSQNFTGTTSWDIKFSDQYHWQDRKSTGFAIQGSGLADKRESAAWEYFIDICNQANMDIWLNIPISAADDYVLGLAQLLRDSLKSNLNIYVENDNEVWNSAPAFVGTFDYNHDQAVSLGLTDEENITRRAHELAMLFSAVFGQGEINKRVRVILASHAPMLKWWVQPMLEYLNAHFGPPKDYIWGLSRQTYFRAKDAENGGIGQMLDAFMKNIKYQLNGDPVNSSGRIDWVRVAKEWQLPGGVTSYEGGPDTPSGGSTDNLSNKIMLSRDPGMIQVMRYNLVNNWWDIGGRLALHFTLFSHYTRYGAYGLTDDLHDPDRNYKFEALRHPVQVITRIEKEPDDIRFSVYPNPSKGIFYISSDIKRPVKITIFDVPGQEKLTTIMKNGIVAISTSGWDPGVYVIMFGDENPDHASKILVQ